ncbi:pif-3 [Hyphantria cunea granulovirus]|uniref:Pif-3 n=1 Tax=Hyphantria cunea granulovirus TaxID=307448 RepID=A0AAF1D261_9BBAC|nr:pif-3 [Hyphantria cunea granulovirus]QBQ01582.1 pif-3 [Hyphantria cunea granulovirus]
MSLNWILFALVFVFACVLGARLLLNTEIKEAARVPLLFQRHNTVDCDSVRTPCITSEQCHNNCQSGVGMSCVEGFCGRAARVEHSFEDCDITRGMIMVLEVFGSLAVEQRCISTFRDVIDDDSELRPYVCGNEGVMHINVEEGPVRVEDCTCAEGFTRFAFAQGAFGRITPVCLPNSVARLFSLIYPINER